MLRHTGEQRTYIHNAGLAALLCMTAGFVNVTGLLAFMVLTTNVTGHAGLFADKLSSGQWSDALAVGTWMLMFLAGAFFSGFYIRITGRHRSYAYTVPILIEALILTAVGLLGHRYNSPHAHRYFAAGLLFAMGMQNALVTMVSGSVVRTTHLTGMFTDLGIDLSALFFAESKSDSDLSKRLFLKLIIIAFFIGGGIAGGYIYGWLQIYTLFIPAGLLLIALLYDALRNREVENTAS